MWVGPQILAARRVRPGPCGDLSDLPPLATAAAAVMPFDQALADAGHGGEANQRHCREGLGADNPIPAKTRRSLGSRRRHDPAAAGDGAAAR